VAEHRDQRQRRVRSVGSRLLREEQVQGARRDQRRRRERARRREEAPREQPGRRNEQRREQRDRRPRADDVRRGRGEVRLEQLAGRRARVDARGGQQREPAREQRRVREVALVLDGIGGAALAQELDLHHQPGVGLEQVRLELVEAGEPQDGAGDDEQGQEREPERSSARPLRRGRAVHAPISARRRARPRSSASRSQPSPRTARRSSGAREGPIPSTRPAPRPS
jgi:hypothetical protein